MRNFTFIFFLCALIFVTSTPHAQELPNKQDEYERLLPAEAYEPENIPDEYLEEALNFNGYCTSTFKMNQYYNCECLATRYLDKRIEGGDSIGPSAIMMDLEEECLDTTQAAGSMHYACMTNYNLLPLQGDPEEYCDCVANEYAKFIEDNKVEPNSKNFIRVQSHVMSVCTARDRRKAN